MAVCISTDATSVAKRSAALCMILMLSMARRQSTELGFNQRAAVKACTCSWGEVKCDFPSIGVIAMLSLTKLRCMHAGLVRWHAIQGHAPVLHIGDL